MKPQSSIAHCTRTHCSLSKLETRGDQLCQHRLNFDHWRRLKSDPPWVASRSCGRAGVRRFPSAACPGTPPTVPDPRLRLIQRRTLSRPLILRRSHRPQRAPSRAPRDPYPARNRLDRHLLSPMMTTDLGPVLDGDPSPIAEEGSELSPRRGVSLQPMPTSFGNETWRPLLCPLPNRAPDFGPAASLGS